jgi:hypothetical protein
MASATPNALLRAPATSPPQDTSQLAPPAPPQRAPRGAFPRAGTTALARSPETAAAAAADTDRPLLRLVPSDPTADDDDARAPVPETGIAKAQAIARAAAGAITYEDDGRVSVLFPPPGAVTAAPGPVLAREGDEASEAPAPAPASTQAAAAPAHAGAIPALDRDELYQDFMRRLRRDVLEQREQLGELF